MGRLHHRRRLASCQYILEETLRALLGVARSPQFPCSPGCRPATQSIGKAQQHGHLCECGAFAPLGFAGIREGGGWQGEGHSDLIVRVAVNSELAALTGHRVGQKNLCAPEAHESPPAGNGKDTTNGSSEGQASPLAGPHRRTLAIHLLVDHHIAEV
jgi:hypothetical protein